MQAKCVADPAALLTPLPLWLWLSTAAMLPWRLQGHETSDAWPQGRLEQAGGVCHCPVSFCLREGVQPCWCQLPVLLLTRLHPILLGIVHRRWPVCAVLLYVQVQHLTPFAPLGLHCCLRERLQLRAVLLMWAALTHWPPMALDPKAAADCEVGRQSGTAG